MFGMGRSPEAPEMASVQMFQDVTNDQRLQRCVKGSASGKNVWIRNQQRKTFSTDIVGGFFGRSIVSHK